MTQPASFWDSFASMVAVPIPFPCMKPCNVSCKAMESCNLLFMINSQTFHMNFTYSIYLYSPPTLEINTIIIHVSAVRMRPSRNASFVALTSLYHHLGSGYFSLVLSLNQTFRCSSLIPDGPHSHPMRSPQTATLVSFPFGGPSAISAGCTSIWIALPSGGAACIGPPSGLRCAPALPWLGVPVVHWYVGKSSGYFPMIPLSGLPLSAHQSLSPSYSPSVSFPPEVLP